MIAPRLELALRKDGHVYLFRDDGESHAALLAVLRRFARDPELNFSWHDAAVVCAKMRQPGTIGATAGVLSAADRLR